MKQTYKTSGVVLALGILAMSSSAFAYTPENDLMKIKGYSPEVIQTANQQRNRQEWKEASVQSKSTTEKFFHNIYYGNWTGSIDDFGSEIIREH
jgi:hypothetical protein